MSDLSLKGVMRTFPQDVTAVTVEGNDGPRGITVSSFTSVSLTPPLVLICILKESRAHDAIQKKVGSSSTSWARGYGRALRSLREPEARPRRSHSTGMASPSSKAVSATCTARSSISSQGRTKCSLVKWIKSSSARARTRAN